MKLLVALYLSTLTSCAILYNTQEDYYMPETPIYCDEAPDDYACVERPESETAWLRRQVECAVTRCYDK